MPNADSVRVPKYAKHKATGQARIQINGRTVYLGKYGSTESHEAYKRAIAEWGQRGSAPPSKRVPLILVQPQTPNEIPLLIRRVKSSYGKGGKPSSLRNLLCSFVALRICSSIFTSSA